MTTWAKTHTLEMVCPYCDKDFNVLLDETIITHEDWQALVKNNLKELKEERKKAKEKWKMELKYCNHCPQNPKADPPLIEMKNVQIDAYVYDKIVSAGSNPSCLLCHTINDIIDTFKGKKAWINFLPPLFLRTFLGNFIK